jgi:iron complex outermembrane receptor protein
VLSGSSTPATSTTTASTGNSNINALNLRSLGANRTLVLIDGQRSVASSLSGLVDINTIPQDLVQRVDVVTGGASAVYGSDALGGVVNFILDKNFTGLKTTLEYGGTTHGDGDNAMGGLTWGTAFGEGRGHFIFSGNYRYQDSIPINDRDWNLKGWQFMNNPNYTATNGQAKRLLLDHVSVSTGIAGGIITDTALRGTAFGVGGTPYQFNFGDLVTDPDMHGGDWEKSQVRGTRAGSSLLGGSRTTNLFTRGSWDLTDNINVYAQASYSRDKNENNAFSLEDTGSITLQADNAFIPASVKSALDANGISSFHLGTMHPDLGIAVATNTREVYRFVTGADGKFADGWKWDAYYQLGIAKLDNLAKNMWSNDNLDLAYDAVVNPANGAIVCRSTLTNPGNGCQPYNPMGIGVNSQAAIDYVQGNGQQMWRTQQLDQNVAALSVSGSPFSTWAGEVSIATGIEWRMEQIGHGKNDELSNSFGWWVGGYPSTKGGYNVKEAFLETLVPLAKDLPFLQALDLSGAVRATDYSTSGEVESWKLGLNWTAIDDVRFRTSLSHDIRAPNLEELYSKGSGGAPAITNPWDNDATQYISAPRLGNPNLLPEKADTFGAGIVLTPTFAPGLALSVDYWNINIKDAIGVITDTQIIIDNCYAGQSEYCSAIDFDADGKTISIVRRSPFNYTSQIARGIDFEASYHFAPSALYEPIPGIINLRALATNYMKNATTTNGVVDDTAGMNTSTGTPTWKWTASVDYGLNAFRGSFSARGVSKGVYDNDWIECSSDCPTSAGTHITVSDNHIPSTVVFDASTAYTFNVGTTSIEAFLNVRNVFDRDPPVVAANPGGYSYTFAPANAALYDVLGRTFTMGFRTSF